MYLNTSLHVEKPEEKIELRSAHQLQYLTVQLLVVLYNLLLMFLTAKSAAAVATPLAGLVPDLRSVPLEDIAGVQLRAWGIIMRMLPRQEREALR